MNRVPRWHPKKLRGAKSTTVAIEDYGSDIPIKPKLTISQRFEGFGVEETLHWLQSQGVKGLLPLPAFDKRIQALSGMGVKYLLQRHEMEALQAKGEFFMEKYGKNPLAELESFVASRKTQDKY